MHIIHLHINASPGVAKTCDMMIAKKIHLKFVNITFDASNL